jgi:hypothetical protein
MAKLVNLVFLASGSGRWLSSIVFVLVVVMAGLVLPQLLPSGPAVAEAASVPAAAAPDMWNYSPPSLPEGPDTRAMLLRLGLGTVLVLGLGVGTLWLSKRWLQVKAVPSGGTRQLRLVEVLPLQGRCCIYLVQAGSRQILAGADAGGLKALLPLTDSFEQSLTEAHTRELEGGNMHV